MAFSSMLVRQLLDSEVVAILVRCNNNSFQGRIFHNWLGLAVEESVIRCYFGQNQQRHTGFVLHEMTR